MDEFERFVSEHGVTAAMGGVVLLAVVIDGWFTRRAVRRWGACMPAAAAQSVLSRDAASQGAQESAAEECADACERAFDAIDSADDSPAASRDAASVLAEPDEAVAAPSPEATSLLAGPEDGVTTVYRLPVGETDERETVVITMDMELLQSIAGARK